MSKYILPGLLCSFIFLLSFQTQSIQNLILSSLKSNDSKTLVKYFSPNVNLSLNGEEKILNKFQAELLLTDFFKNNRITNIKMLSSNGNKQSKLYAVYSMQTAKDNFQIVVKFMEIKGETLVIEFKVD